MDLNEWSSLPKERQRELTVQWYKSGQWDDYENLALDAAKALRKALASVPEVTVVELGGGDIISVQEPMIHFRELVLNACTLLPESSRLGQIPSQFLGFQVQQVNLGDRVASFLRTWKRLFKELKGWNEQETINWAEQWMESLMGSTSPLYSWGPVKVAIPSLVDGSVQRLAGNNLQNLYGEIRDVIWNVEGGRVSAIQFPDTVEDYDWDSVRKKISELIGKYSKEKRES